VCEGVQRLVLELFQLMARHGIDAEDFKHLFKVFDTENPPVVCSISISYLQFSVIQTFFIVHIMRVKLCKS